MKVHLHNLFVPHHGNNHKPKLLHHKSLSKLVLLILFFQLVITAVSQANPGVLGYASNITTDQIIALTNERRAAANLPALSFNAVLADAARQKAAHMFTNNYWAHNSPDGTTPWYFFKNVGYNYLYAGENLARDFGESSAVVQAWMDSPTHRDNIMSNRYSEIGVAVVNGILNGHETTLVVQHFGKPSSAVAAVPQQAVSETKQVEEQSAARPSESMANKPTIIQKEPVEDVLSEIKPENSQELVFTQAMSLSPRTPEIAYVSAFDLTKSINLALTLIVIMVLAIDAFLIWHRKTVRRSGKSFIHLSLFVLVALLILLTQSGKIM